MHCFKTKPTYKSKAHHPLCERNKITKGKTLSKGEADRLAEEERVKKANKPINLTDDGGPPVARGALDKYFH